jgi:hypothetical protein
LRFPVRFVRSTKTTDWLFSGIKKAGFVVGLVLLTVTGKAQQAYFIDGYPGACSTCPASAGVPADLKISGPTNPLLLPTDFTHNP